MYAWLRNTHLLLGLFAVPLLVMYGWSSVQMAHQRWFTLKPATTESRVTLAGAPAENARAAARRLMDEHGLRGELAQVRTTDSGFSFRIARTGTFSDVSYSRQTGEAHIRTNAASFQQMLNRVHHASGLWHEYWLSNVWGGLVGLVSLGLFLLGATGIYLWFKVHTERVVGAVLLAISLGYSLTLMVLMRAAGN
jgi:hypothetical protein